MFGVHKHIAIQNVISVYYLYNNLLVLNRMLLFHKCCIGCCCVYWSIFFPWDTWGLWRDTKRKTCNKKICSSMLCGSLVFLPYTSDASVWPREWKYEHSCRNLELLFGLSAHGDVKLQTADSVSAGVFLTTWTHFHPPEDISLGLFTDFRLAATPSLNFFCQNNNNNNNINCYC